MWQCLECRKTFDANWQWKVNVCPFCGCSAEDNKDDTKEKADQVIKLLEKAVKKWLNAYEAEERKSMLYNRYLCEIDNLLGVSDSDQEERLRKIREMKNDKQES